MRELVAGLPADRHGVDRQRAQPLGRGVHRRGQPGRPGADDDDVVAAVGQGVGGQAELTKARSPGRRPLQRGRAG